MSRPAQLSLGLGAPEAPKGSWICGACGCGRPDDQLWCSHLADPVRRDRLHQLLGDCDNAICVPVRPCEACTESILAKRLPWVHAYECSTCRALPGALHRGACEDAGTRVPTMQEQLEQLAQAQPAGPLVCRVPSLQEQERFAAEFPEFVAPMPPARRG